METVDEVIRDKTIEFIDKAKAAGKPFFVWYNPTRMHVVTHLSDKYENMRNAENGWSIQEAGMAQLDDNVGAVMHFPPMQAAASFNMEAVKTRQGN
jgi:arylsulfatase